MTVIAEVAPQTVSGAFITAGFHFVSAWSAPSFEGLKPRQANKSIPRDLCDPSQASDIVLCIHRRSRTLAVNDTDHLLFMNNRCAHFGASRNRVEHVARIPVRVLDNHGSPFRRTGPDNPTTD